MATLVKFRKTTFENEGLEIVAVFPQLKHNAILYGNDLIMCYAHLGQHSSCSTQWVKNCTKPAKYSEYKLLKKELKQIGYDNLKICK